MCYFFVNIGMVCGKVHRVESNFRFKTVITVNISSHKYFSIKKQGT